MFGSCLVRMSADVRSPRALDAAAANVCADRRRKTKALLRSSCHSSRGVKGFAAPRSVIGEVKQKPPERGKKPKLGQIVSGNFSAANLLRSAHGIISQRHVVSHSR